MMGRTPGPPATIVLTKGIISAAAREKPTEAVLILGRAAGVMISSMERDADSTRRSALAVEIALLAEKMDSADASRFCDQVIGILLQRRPEVPQPERSDSVDKVVAMLLPGLDTRTAHERALSLAIQGVGEWNEATAYEGKGGVIPASATAGAPPMMGRMAVPIPWEPKVPDVFNMILTDNSRAHEAQRAAKMTASAGPGLEGALEAAVRISSEPFPCRLTTEELVDLLKMPTCFGAIRRVVLDHLGNRYGRRFVNHWAFVRYATEEKLGLDLTTPPSTPTPAPATGRRSTPMPAPTRWPWPLRDPSPEPPF